MKICSKCGLEKELYEFPKNKQQKNGYNSYCKKCKNSGAKIYYEKNKTEISSRASKRYFKNKKPNKITIEDKHNTKIKQKLRHSLRKRIRNVLFYNKCIKHHKTNNLIGCSVWECKKHIELQFKDGMSWDNYGLHGWHIDHIIPCASFDLKDPEQQKQCFHYTNLQPLWAKDNLSKGKKFNQ